MANPEHVEIVKQGADAIREWRERNPYVRLDLRRADLSGAKLSPAKLTSADLTLADLSGAHLSGADLSWADLSWADLSWADLSGADLSGANLSGADPRGADLSRANLSRADLNEADLTEADLSRANLSGANLRGAKLSGANLCNTDLTQADLRDADLNGANLTRTRLIRTNMEGANVTGACVAEVHIQDLISLPKAVDRLRLDLEGGDVLTGEEAASFFHMPAVVEVYLTQCLSQQELGVYHFHVGELHHSEVAKGVFLAAHRHESGSSVLRFQGTTYQEIYEVLPDLLAPFRMAEAVDWRRTVEAIPQTERAEAIFSLIKTDTRQGRMRWKFAERMAELFESYHNANVYRIKEGRSRGISIDIFTNKEIAERLARQRLPEPRTLNISVTGDNATITGESRVTGDQNIVQGDVIGGAVGKGSVNARDITVYKQMIERSSLDDETKAVLTRAREALEEVDLSETDKNDAADELGKISDELHKPNPNGDRIKRAWTTIQGIVSTVGTILKSTEMIGKWLV